MKQLVEDEQTGAKTFRYVRTGTNHYSFAFTYDCIAWAGEQPFDPSLWGWVGPGDEWDDRKLPPWDRPQSGSVMEWEF